MKISLAIHFPLCLSRYFRLFFSTLNKFLDIFDGSNNTSKMSRNTSRVEKHVENISTNTRESELPG